MSPPVLQSVDQNGNFVLLHPNGQVSHENLTSSSGSAPTSNLPMMGIHNLNMEPASESTKTEAPVAFVKMEQLDANSSSLSSVPDEPQFTTSIASVKLSSSSPPPSQSKPPPKKRRSWGQELPEPTTNLPPRKRAKTDAEKEQRRIERVKRNRQAAHNSRERKRQEHEALEDENRLLTVQNKALEEELARARRQIAELTGNKTPASPALVSQTQAQGAAPIQHLFMKSPFHSPALQAESLFTAEQLPLMGSLTKVSSSFSSQTSTTTTPVLSNSSDFTSPATEPLPFTPTIDPLSLGQTRQLARLSRQDDLQCHPFAQASMKSSTLAAVLSVISIFSGLVHLMELSPICGLLPSLPVLTLAFINHLLSSVASSLTRVSLIPTMAFWASLSSLASSPTRALDPRFAERQLQGRTMPLSKCSFSDGVFTGVLRGMCSGSTSVGWG